MANSANPNSNNNNWSSPGPAAFDFRSDVVTTPTAAMLTAITQTTLLDDVFLEDPTTTSLESFIASLTGKEASLFVVSGTMGNQVSLAAHLTGPPQGILCDHRAHIRLYEAGGAATLNGAMVESIVPRNAVYLTLEDVRANAMVPEGEEAADVHICPTKVVCLENTLNGAVLPLEECRRISAWARERGIKMHLDGARLWEAVVAGAGSLKDYCACFDSVSLCFSKGLGAPIGSIVVGEKPFIKRARWIRKMIGGGLRQAGVVSAAARVSVEETFLGGKLKKSHENAKKVEEMWLKLGGKVTSPVETNMVILDLEAAHCSNAEFIKLAQTHGLRMLCERLVVHYQISDDALERLERLMEDVLKDTQ
jgi:threonine aldolase